MKALLAGISFGSVIGAIDIVLTLGLIILITYVSPRAMIFGAHDTEPSQALQVIAWILIPLTLYMTISGAQYLGSMFKGVQGYIFSVAGMSMFWIAMFVLCWILSPVGFTFAGGVIVSACGAIVFFGATRLTVN